jgi:hypothetical protein
MIRRITISAVVVAVVLPALLGYAASFSSSPVVSQEFHVSVEDVQTEQIGGPATEPLTSSIADPDDGGANLPVLPPGETDCPGVDPGAAGADPCRDGTEPRAEEELPALAAEPAPPPEPEIDAPDKAPKPFDANPAPFFSLDPAGQ